MVFQGESGEGLRVACLRDCGFGGVMGGLVRFEGEGGERGSGGAVLSELQSRPPNALGWTRSRSSGSGCQNGTTGGRAERDKVGMKMVTPPWSSGFALGARCRDLGGLGVEASQN